MPWGLAMTRTSPAAEKPDAHPVSTSPSITNPNPKAFMAASSWSVPSLFLRLRPPREASQMPSARAPRTSARPNGIRALDFRQLEDGREGIEGGNPAWDDGPTSYGNPRIMAGRL